MRLERWSRRTVALLALGLAGSSCTSVIEDGFDELRGPPTTAVIVGPNEDAEIEELSLDDAVLTLMVDHSSCDELEGWIEEGPDEVVVGVWVRELTTVSDDPATVFACEDIGLVDPVDLELAVPLRDRNLIVQSSSTQGAEGGLCFRIDGTDYCHQFTLRTPGGDIEIAEPIEGNPTGLAIGSGQTATLVVGGITVEVTTPVEVPTPLVVAWTLVGTNDPPVWGSVEVHNARRDLAGLSSLDSRVDGRDAFLVTASGGGISDPPSVVVPVGPWSLDISLWSDTPEAQEEAMAEFLANLTITESANGMPIVSDGTGWLAVDNSELSVRFDGGGFQLSINPNCDNSSEASCRPGVGWIRPTDYLAWPTAGREPDPVQPWFMLAMPDDLVVAVTDLGRVGELVTCSGTPAFDPALLPTGASRDEAVEAVRTYTGVQTWRRRLQLGIETWYTEAADDPGAVATLVRDEAGLWGVESVTVCH